MLATLSRLITPITKIVSDAKIRKQEIQTLRHELRITKIKGEIEFQKMQAEQDTDWDLLAMQQMKYSIFDEILKGTAVLYLWYILLSGIIFIFMPEQADKMTIALQESSKIISELPVIIEFLIIGVIVNSLGLRWLIKLYADRFKFGSVSAVSKKLSLDKRLDKTTNNQ